MIDPKQTATAYQPLFDLLHSQHGLTCLQSEMDDIIDAVNTVESNLADLLVANLSDPEYDAMVKRQVFG